MADDVRSLDHYTLDIEDKLGTGARVLAALRDNDVDLLAFWGYSTAPGKATLELLPVDADGFLAAAKAAGFASLRTSRVFYVTGSDRPGTIAEKLKQLSDAGVSVVAAQGVSDSAGRFGAVIYVKPEDVQRAGTALNAL